MLDKYAFPPLPPPPPPPAIRMLFLVFHVGKDYQESRRRKRERRQPGTIPDLAYLHWERTGQAPAGPYSVSLALKVYSRTFFSEFTK